MSISIVQDVAYQIDFKNRKPILHVFGRDTTTREPTVTKIKDFEPYFYVPYDEAGRITQLDGCRRGESATDCFGRNVVKVFTDLPGRVSEVRDQFSFTDESDILFEKRFIADKKLKKAYKIESNSAVSSVQYDGYIPPRILFFDIEIDNDPGDMPNPSTVKYPVATIQFGDSYTGKKFIITNGIDHRIKSNHIVAKSEKELFEIFYQLIKKIDPDVYTGWYCLQFDLPYLVRRANVIGMRTTALCRLNDARCDLMPNGKYIVRTPGRQCFDMLDGFKKLKSSESEREDNGLKTVSAEYGFPYKDYGAQIKHLYATHDWDTLLQYCENDITSLMIIEEKTQMFRFFDSVRHFTGCKLEDTIYNSKIIESYLMQSGIKPMPRRLPNNSDSTFEGATVILPPFGLHKNVGWVDLKSLYPTIMMAYDISPDVDKLVPKILKHIVAERDRLRTINKTSQDINLKYQEQVLKYLANSFYGVLGAKSFRLYNEATAASVTRYGREISKIVRDKIESLGYHVIYCDTDSAAFNPVNTLEEGLKVQDILNGDLKTYSIATNAIVDFTLKLEKIHDSLFFKMRKKGNEAAKKKYVGLLLWHQDYGFRKKMSYVGVEIKRSDQAKAVKDLQTEFFNILFIEDDLPKALALIRQRWKDIKSGKLSVYDVSIPKGIHTEHDDPWYRGREVAKVQYQHIFDPSVKPRLVYLLKRDSWPREICIDGDFDTSIIQSEVDWTTHAEKLVKNKMESYMEALGYTWDYIVNGQQTLW